MRRYKKKSRRTGKYKSKLESVVARKLGKKATYETVKLSYTLPKSYTVDFVVGKDDGARVLLEVKGYLRYEDQVKMRYVKECNPLEDIRFYFPVDNRVQGSKMKNSEWCERYGFVYYIGRLPKVL